MLANTYIDNTFTLISPLGCKGLFRYRRRRRRRARRKKGLLARVTELTHYKGHHSRPRRTPSQPRATFSRRVSMHRDVPAGFAAAYSIVPITTPTSSTSRAHKITAAFAAWSCRDIFRKISFSLPYASAPIGRLARSIHYSDTLASF